MSVPSLTLAVTKAAADLKEKGFKPDFLFVGNSVLHIASLNAWLSKMAHEGMVLSGVVCNDVQAGKKSQFLPRDIVGHEDGRIVCLREHVDYVVNRPAAERLKSLLVPPVGKNEVHHDASSRPFYLMYSDHGMPNSEYWRAALSVSDNLKCIALEEGVASYLSIESENLLFAYLHKSAVKRNLELCKIRLLARRKERIRELTSNAVPVERFGVFLDKDGTAPRVNNDYLYWMKRQFESKRSEADTELSKDFSGHVILLGTANEDFVDQEIVDGLFLDVIEEVARAGLKTYYRPHPRQPKSFRFKLPSDVCVDDNPSLTVEELISYSSTKPVAIIGFCSTAQLIGGVFWDIPGIGISKLLHKRICEKNGGIAARRFSERLVDSEGRFGRYIDQIDSIEKISYVLKKYADLDER